MSTAVEHCPKTLLLARKRNPRRHAVPLTLGDQQLATASAIAAEAVQYAMVSVIENATGDAIWESAVESAATPAFRREVHQATEIILVKSKTTATIAYPRLQAYAFANGITVHAVARDVRYSSLTFEISPRDNKPGKEEDHDDRDT